MKHWALMLSVSLLGSSCVRHIYPYNHKVREYQSDDYASLEEQRGKGSLWSEGTANLFEDARAMRVGDILTIRVDERADATRDANTQTSRKNESSAGISAFFTAMQKLSNVMPGVDPSALIGASSSSEFEGAGSTSRSGEVNAVLPVRVKKQMPNGDFYVEGTKVLLLNDEESYLYLSGVVRPVDIGPDNSVSSSRLADVELEYTGRGVISERQSPGWLSRVLDYVWPF